MSSKFSATRADAAEHRTDHLAGVGAAPLRPATPGLIRVGSRRWFLEAGLGGLAGLSRARLPQLEAASPIRDRGAADPGARRAVIMFWLSGGPSHIDMWDPKPDAPQEIRSPFGVVQTRLPGVCFTEHLPLQASIADKLSIIRSVDCKSSNHTPITMQAGNPLARRTNDGRDGGGYPSMGSVAAKFRGPNDPDLPAFVGLARSWTSDVWGAGDMGVNYEPVKGLELAGKFALPQGVTLDRLQDRDRMRRRLDGFARRLDQHGSLGRFDRFTQQAYEMVVTGKVQAAFDMSRESEKTRAEYGRTSIGEKALLARRLVESGVTFVLVSGAWGYFDHHGDQVRWGGIERGLKPLLPRVDRALYALVNDLHSRGLLESTLVMMLGEFGRSPVINKDRGRDHWTNVMSMVVAGGKMPHGQVIGATDSRGGAAVSAPVRPQDLAATTFRHLGIDPDAHWTNRQGRPIPVITEGGRPIAALS